MKKRRFRPGEAFNPAIHADYRTCKRRRGLEEIIPASGGRPQRFRYEEESVRDGKRSGGMIFGIDRRSGRERRGKKPAE